MRGNARVIGAWNPQRGIPFHAMIADHEIFHADEHGVTDMQFARHIGRRNRNGERFDVRVEIRFVGIIVRLEESASFPHRINALFGGFEIVGFW